MINKILNEDCLEGMKNIPDASIDMVLCDMPYGTTVCKWDIVIDLEKTWIELKRIGKSTCPFVLFNNEPFGSILRMSNIKNYCYDWIWNKVTARGHLVAKYRPLQQTENIAFFKNIGKCLYIPQMIERPKNKIVHRKKREYSRTEIMGGEKIDLPPKIYDKWYPKNIIKISNADSSITSMHPTQKPVALMEYLIKTYSNENDIVLDFCMGSGTTAIAAINTNRRFIGFENNKDYYDISIKRIQEHSDKQTTKEP